MKYIVAFIAWLMLACIVSADEFTDRLDQFESKTKAITKPAKDRCGCDGPEDCVCGKIEGDCHCGPCTAAKAKRASTVKRGKAPSIPYKHTCGCSYPGGPGCNCAELGGCHCAENTQFNRVNPRWVKDSDGWGLYRGEQQFGWLNAKGVFHPLREKEWYEPDAAPIPLPWEQPAILRMSAPAYSAPMRRG